ncbi:hypothetical protein OF83DRAFT_297356 [Amylostereum chailletii]|nr:hypothetical protein OF83DRAFT_297356 [Amylostereum chailletii]
MKFFSTLGSGTCVQFRAVQATRSVPLPRPSFPKPCFSPRRHAQFQPTHVFARELDVLHLSTLLTGVHGLTTGDRRQAYQIAVRKANEGLRRAHERRSGNSGQWRRDALQSHPLHPPVTGESRVFVRILASTTKLSSGRKSVSTSIASVHSSPTSTVVLSSHLARPSAWLRRRFMGNFSRDCVLPCAKWKWMSSRMCGQDSLPKHRRVDGHPR